MDLDQGGDRRFGWILGEVGFEEREKSDVRKGPSNSLTQCSSRGFLPQKFEVTNRLFE